MTPIKSPTMPSVIDGSAVAEFRRSFNAAHFQFRHNLAGHPLFSIARLGELAERMTDVGAGHHVVAFSVTRKTPARKFDQLARHEGARETLSRIETGSSWLKLSFVQEYDPQYREIHDQILEDAADCSGLPLRQALRWSSMTILLSSPGIITPYHIDHESNLLFQIAGEKDLWLFDPRDVRALREDEIENFYAGNVNAADFRLAAQPLGCLYRLAPGVAVHNPPLGPHWVRNGNGVSVSVSLNFSLRSSEQRARVYQMNYYLRRLGWHPSPPSGSRFRDWIKGSAMRIGAVARPRNLEQLLQPGPRRLWRRLSPGRATLRPGGDGLGRGLGEQTHNRGPDSAERAK